MENTNLFKAMRDSGLSVTAKSIYAFACSDTKAISVKDVISGLHISQSAYFKHFSMLEKYGYAALVQSKNGLINSTVVICQ